MNPRRQRWRLSWITAAAMTLVLLSLGAGFLYLGRQVLFEDARSRLEADAAETAQGVTEGGSPRGAIGTLTLVWGQDGEILSAPAGVSTVPFRQAAHAAVADRPRVDVLSVAGSQLLVDSRVAFDRQGHPIGVIQTATPLALVNAAENRLLSSVLLAGAAALVLAALAAWLVAGRATRPIEAALRRQRQFTADASHELRTPLTVIDASLQVLTRHPERSVGESIDVLDSAQREVRRMVRMVDGLLTLARADNATLAAKVVPTDIERLLATIADDVAFRAAETGHEVAVESSAPATADVDAEQVRQLVLILIENAFVHTPAGTPVTISSRRTGADVLIEVIDRGPGIPESDREGVFDRFRRLQTARPGTGSGLGLSIARELADRMDGSLHLANARPGLVARLSIPATRNRRTHLPKASSTPAGS